MFLFLSPVKNTIIKQGCDVGAAKASSCHSTEVAAEFKDNSLTSCDSDGPCADNAAGRAEECKDAQKLKVTLKQAENEAKAPYPEPRLPFPCISSMSGQDQNIYLGFLMSKKTRDPPQVPVFSPPGCYF